MNESEVPKQPAAPPDPLGSSPTPPPDAEPFVATFDRMWARVKAHKVVQWTLAYLAVAYTLLHGAEMLAGSLGWPHGFLRVFTLGLILGVPVIVTLAWYHGARGLQRVSGTEIMIIAILLALGGAFLWRDSNHSEEALEGVPQTTPSIVSTLPNAPVAPDSKSIAVLPFTNMSSDTEQEYLADGISEELLNLLTQVPELRVIARTSSFSFKGKAVDISEIARKLNVAHVLEGSVRKSGNRLRITAQLVRASDSSHLWSQTFDRELTDVFDIQDQIAAAVAAELKAKLLGSAPKTKTTDPRTYALFLQAREVGREFTKANFEESNNLYRQVLALDPMFVGAWEGLAFNYGNQAIGGFMPIDEGVRLAREAIDNAVALGPTRPFTYGQMAYIEAGYDLNLQAAANHLQAALALEPANPDVLLEASALMRRLGRLDEAIAIGEFQVSLDPINPLGLESLAAAYRYVGRLDEAFAAWRTIFSLSPDYMSGHEAVGELFLQKKDAKSALAEMQKEVTPGIREIGLSMAHHALGNESESNAAISAAIEKYSKLYPFTIAYAFAYRGDPDRAFEWLEKAVEYHDLYFVAVASHPVFTSVHSDARWLPFLRKHGFAPEQLAAVKFEVKLPQ